MKPQKRNKSVDEKAEREAEFVRQKVGKALIDKFPKTRAFLRGYLAIHYPKKRIRDIRA